MGKWHEAGTGRERGIALLLYLFTEDSHSTWNNETVGLLL